jgi:hypothetical protein
MPHVFFCGRQDGVTNLSLGGVGLLLSSGLKILERRLMNRKKKLAKILASFGLAATMDELLLTS